MLKAVKSSEAAEHDAEHGYENPASGAGFGFFIVADESAEFFDPGGEAGTWVSHHKCPVTEEGEVRLDLWLCGSGAGRGV